MLRCQLSPVVTRSRRKNTIKLDAITELIERRDRFDGSNEKGCSKVNERDKEHMWHPSVGLPGQIYRHKEDEAPCAPIGAPGRSSFEQSWLK
jgi:hypothetical protein